jgi:hypothetical protein
MEKHKHEWEPRVAVVGKRPGSVYMFCAGCGKKRAVRAKKRRW